MDASEIDWALTAAWLTAGLLVLSMAALAFLAFWHHRSRAAQKALHVRLDAAESERQRLLAALQRLRPYEKVVDAEAAAATLRAEAERSVAHAFENARRETERITAKARAEAQASLQTAEAAATAIRTRAESAAAHAFEDARRDAERRTAEAQATHANAQTEAARLMASAQRDAERVIAEAQAMNAQARASVQRAEEEASSIRTRAETAAAQTTERAQVSSQRTLAQASADAARITEDANRRAKEIAGEALEAVRESKRLEQTAQAMKNIIEGYGDRYVMPTISLLDELAEAGQRLKAARGRSRDMISDGTAATCDYAEPNRRTTAISFVLDAFNGKVDTILSDVRHDNFGTLQQKIRDAFLLVNQNGRAFRDARVLPAYLDARLDELHWAVIAHALKLKEREEQKQIKERMREEERAQREFEKAKRESEKEEETIRKAMERARADIEKSTDEERARFQQKLSELTERLRAAEEKNQRAISMAQQTKSGHVYVISNIGSFGEHVYKIGMTRRLDPLERVHELGDASVPFEFDVHALIRSDNAPALEHALHQRFARNQVNKVNPRKEFFRVTLQEVREEIERMAIEVAWTLTAAAREFRETQATERALANKTIDEAAWLQQQAKADATTDEQDLAEAVA